MVSHYASREIKYRTISCDEWEAVKDVFEDFYLNERWNYRQISEYLWANHGFYPTPNQFKKRVKFWRLKKNSRKSSGGVQGAQSLLFGDELHGQPRSSPYPLPPNRNPITDVDPWSMDIEQSSEGQQLCFRSQHAVFITETMNGQNGPNCGLADCSARSGAAELAEDSENLEGQFDIEFLRSERAYLTTKDSTNWIMPALNASLSPFPNSQSSTNNSWNSSQTCSITIEMAFGMESQYCRDFKRLRKMDPDQIAELARGMKQIADVYYSEKFGSLAEPWYRRVVTAKQLIRSHEPQETLRACMGVIKSVYHQSRYVDAYDLHRSFNVRLQTIIPKQDSLYIESKKMWSDLFGQLQMYGEEENELHELVQINLTTSGPWHRNTLSASYRLGRCLCDRHSYIDGEALLRMTLAGIHEREPPQLKQHTSETAIALRIFLRLVSVLRRSARNAEAETLIFNVKQRYRALPGQNRMWFKFDYQMACLLFDVGRHEECDKILNTILKQQHEVDRNSSTGMDNAQHLLARNFDKMGRFQEAALGYGKAYHVNIKAYGLQDQRTIETCFRLGRCYIKQGLYNEATELFEQTLRDIEALPRRNGLKPPTSEVQDLRELLKVVEVMKSRLID